MERNPTTYAILGILAIHPNQSGYEIRKTVQQSVGFFWGESYGQIYPTLKRLAAEGLIVLSAPAHRKERTRRKEYSITAAGRERLQAWLAVPFRDDPPRDEFLLKLFFASDAGPDVAVEQVKRFQEKNRRMLAMLLELQKLGLERSSHYPGFPYWMLTLNYGVGQLKAAIDWSERAILAIEGLKWG
jgi:PadR family transcriptional regulator, regulatory protein AphA